MYIIHNLNICEHQKLFLTNMALKQNVELLKKKEKKNCSYSVSANEV